MKQHVRDDEFANTILLPDPPDVLNVETRKVHPRWGCVNSHGKAQPV